MAISSRGTLAIIPFPYCLLSRIWALSLIGKTFSKMSLVQLRVYDLSQGMARMLSQSLTGKQIDAIYHTSVVVFGVETYFGQGICQDPPGQSPHGNSPMEVIAMGETCKTVVEFNDFIVRQSCFPHLLQDISGGLSTIICWIIIATTFPTLYVSFWWKREYQAKSPVFLPISSLLRLGLHCVRWLKTFLVNQIIPRLLLRISARVVRIFKHLASILFRENTFDLRAVLIWTPSLQSLEPFSQIILCIWTKPYFPTWKTSWKHV